jgi:hypothetical protein
MREGESGGNGDKDRLSGERYIGISRKQDDVQFSRGETRMMVRRGQVRGGYHS